PPEFIAKEASAKKTIYPAMQDVFNAFNSTPFHQVKVVILGQDPYHGPNQAHGLAFSVKKGCGLPPSLKNIYQELSQDVGFKNPGHGDLSHWAEQGVLLLNTSLTVEAAQAASHRGQGWEVFTDAVIKLLSQTQPHLVFLLWGSQAIAKRPLIDERRHAVLTAPHPSPLSAHRGFLGCKHFSKTNQILKNWGMTPIDWQL
ncbi:MAG: uracil-DNA glycosylase, partial [Gammaproteobacteria bacterium]|nr:uracil-DNA glycosylase [Gammaproteobacteria bacterium]